MEKRTASRDLAVTAGVLTAQLAVFYWQARFLLQNGLLPTSLAEVTYAALPRLLAVHMAAMLAFPLLVLAVFRAKPRELGLCAKSAWLCGGLLAAYIACFFLTRERSAGTVYKYLYCLLSVGLGEELFFRGWAYRRLKQCGVWPAVIVSGLFWGAGHAIFPGVLAGQSVLQILRGALLGIGDSSMTALGGGAGALFFVLILEWSGSLFPAILVHALLDYSTCLPETWQGVGSAVPLLVLLGMGVKRRVWEKKALFRF